MKPKRAPPPDGPWALADMLPLHPLLATCLLVCVSLVCFANSIPGDFVHDDRFAVVENRDADPALTSWSSIFANDFWGTPMREPSSHKSYRPLTVITFRLNRLFLGAGPSGYHVVNVVLHATATLLFRQFAEAILGPRSQSAALIAALCFAAHPIHVEVVANVVGRAEMLCAIFFMLAFLAYKSHMASHGIRSYFMCLLLAAAAMLSKETGLMVLPLCGVYSVVSSISPGSSIWSVLSPITLLRSTWRTLVKLAAPTLILLGLRLWIMNGTPPTFIPEDNPASFSQSTLTRTLTFNYLYGQNAWLLLFPRTLVFDWQMSAIPLLESLSDPRVAWIIAFYAAWLALLHFALSSSSPFAPPTTMAAAVIILTFLPASNILFRVGFVLADRVLYLPSMGFCLLLALAFELLARRIKSRAIVFGLIGVLLALYAAKTIDRNTDWASRERINQSGLNLNPLCAKCHYNLGNFHKERGEMNTAAAHYESVVALWPDHPSSYNNLGVIEESRGNQAAAETRYRTALTFNPNHPSSRLNLGNVLKKRGQLDAAASEYRKAIEINPGEASFYAALADVQYQLGHHSAAKDLYVKSLEMKPDDYIVLNNFATTLAFLEDYEAALSHYTRAIALQSDATEAKLGKVNVLRLLGRDKEAESLSASITSSSDSIDALLQAANLKLSSSKPHEAVTLLQRAWQQAPGSIRIAPILARAYEQAESRARAEAFLQGAVEKWPSWQLHCVVGDYFQRTGQTDEAGVQWRTSLKLTSATDATGADREVYLRMMHNLVTSASLAGQHRDAERYANRLIKLDPNNAEAHFSLGNVVRQSDPARAEAGYKRAAELAPTIARYHGNLAALYHVLKRYPEAVEAYERAIKLDPTDANLLQNFERLKRSHRAAP